MKDSALFRLLRKRFSRRDLIAFREGLQALPEESYDSVIEQALSAAPALEAEFERNQNRVDKLYRSAGKATLGRLRLLMDNSPPPLLLVLARTCFRESYRARLEDPAKSLKLAEAGLQAVTLIGGADYLSAEMRADLEAEAYLYLGNALRISSDFRGAEAAFQAAERLLSRGTGDRSLRADHLHSRRTSASGKRESTKPPSSTIVRSACAGS